VVDAIDEIQRKGSGRGPVPMPIELYLPKPAAPAVEAAAPAGVAVSPLKTAGDSLGLNGARGAWENALNGHVQPVDGDAAISAALLKIGSTDTTNEILGLGMAAKLDAMKRELEEFKAWERLMVSVPPKLWSKLSHMIMAMLETAGPSIQALHEMEAKCAQLLRDHFNALSPEEKQRMLSESDQAVGGPTGL